MTYIADYDTKRAVIECLEILEIKGDNKMIETLQNSARQLLREKLKTTDVDYLIGTLIEARADVREKKVE